MARVAGLLTRVRYDAPAFSHPFPSSSSSSPASSGPRMSLLWLIALGQGNHKVPSTTKATKPSGARPSSRASSRFDRRASHHSSYLLPTIGAAPSFPTPVCRVLCTTLYTYLVLISQQSAANIVCPGIDKALLLGVLCNLIQPPSAHRGCAAAASSPLHAGGSMREAGLCVMCLLSGGVGQGRQSRGKAGEPRCAGW